MKNLSCIIVDDEKESREGLSLLMKELEDFSVDAVCGSGIEAIDAINEFKPDLLLLDIQMPRINGFDVLRNINNQPGAIIFITAYDEYALKAFEVHAVDYLLKPFTDERFMEAIARAKEKISYKQKNNSLSSLLKETQKYERSPDTVFYEDQRKGKERLIVKADGKIHFLNIQEVIWIGAFDYYIKVHTANKFFLVRDTMKNINQKLPDGQFLRIHKSSIVNLSYVERAERGASSGLNLILKNGHELKVSRGYKSELLEKINL